MINNESFLFDYLKKNNGKLFQTKRETREYWALKPGVYCLLLAVEKENTNWWKASVLSGGEVKVMSLRFSTEQNSTRRFEAMFEKV